MVVVMVMMREGFVVLCAEHRGLKVHFYEASWLESASGGSCRSVFPLPTDLHFEQKNCDMLVYAEDPQRFLFLCAKEPFGPTELDAGKYAQGLIHLMNPI